MTPKVANLCEMAPKLSRQFYGNDEPIPFDAEEAKRYLDEARIRVARLSPPDVWTWARKHRPALMESMAQMKKQYDEHLLQENLPMCIKWVFGLEQQAKRIIREYADATNGRNR